MTKQEQISLLDTDLAQHRGVLSADEEQRYIELVAEGYGQIDDSEKEGDEERKGETPISLELIKLHKILQLRIYDASDAVNTFYIGGQPMWINNHDRDSYTSAIQSERRLGGDSVNFHGVTLTLDIAENIIDQLNRYARLCVERTEAHEAAINALTTIEAVDAYDFTVGYPEKLNF